MNTTENENIDMVESGVSVVKIAIIDAEIVGKKNHRFPNLACMKLSAYYKSIGDSVTLKTDYIGLMEFDKILISKVFTKTVVPNPILEWGNVEIGGTGFFYDNSPKLPDEIEHTMPDYHLYDYWIMERLAFGESISTFKYYTDYSIGFTTRGCMRHCPYCVNRNSDASVVHSPVIEFLDESRKKICLLDDNLFACQEW